MKIQGRTMWRCWILMLCATGISCGRTGPQSVGINRPPRHDRRGNGEGGSPRFACPVGFFRLKRNCYYLSAGTAPWREAFFHCTDRNSTLAVLDKSGKANTLRKYLMGDQFAKLERWIGGIYNWEQMTWLWGGSGNKIKYQNFERPELDDPKRYAWHCIVMDPGANYRWKPRGCVEKKHFVCEVPVGRIGRRRKKRIHSDSEPQNQIQKPKGKRGRDKTAPSLWRTDETRNPTRKHTGRRPKVNCGKPENRNFIQCKTGNTRQRKPRKQKSHGTAERHFVFQADSPARTHLQSLSEDTVVMNQFSAGMNDLAQEEILLKT